MNPASPVPRIELACATPAGLGESPLWHAGEQCLYYVDIAARQVLRLDPASGSLRHWQLDSEPGCIALLEGGGLLIAQRDGLWRLDTHSGARQRLAPPPYPPTRQRFNDGKPDAAGRFWVGSIDDARAPEAALFCYREGGFRVVAGGITTSNGLAWSPDQRRMYWADTKAHAVYCFPFDPAGGVLGERQTFAQFEPRAAGQGLSDYGGRPDGAAVDVEGCYWVAMYEGARLLRLRPDGSIERELHLPVQCPTMPAFGDADLRTLYISTARDGRPAEELAAQPWAGCVLKLRVEVPGLPAALARI